jgi:hypothetical protein
MAFDPIACEMQPSDYLVGDRFSVTDLTAGALLSPIVLPHEHPYRPSEPLPPSLRELRDPLTDHPGFR